MIAVFLSGTVFAVSPNSVLAYDVSSLENSIFVEGIETTFYQEGDTVYYVIPSGDPQAVNVDLSNSVIYGGSYGQSKTSSYVTVQSGVVIDKIYGGGYATNSSNADMNENVVISIESGATVGTVYGSGYASSGEYTADVKGSISIENIGTVGNIYGISNSLSSSEVGELVIMLFGGEVTGEVLVVEPSSPEVDFSDGSYSLEIGLSSDLILSGANSVIGSQVYPVTEIYSEADPDAEKVTVDVSNSTRSVGEVVTYLDVNIGNSEAEILSFFSSDYYQFELVNYSDYYAVKIASMVSQNASVEEDEGEDREPLSKEYTVAGTLEEESVEDESFLEEYSDITEGEDGY